MSRVYQKQPSSTVRRAPGAPPPLRPPHPVPGTSTHRGAAPSLRPPHPVPSTSTNRDVRAPTRGRILRPQVPRQEGNDNNAANEDHRMNQQERTTHVGDAFHMITPLTTKREQIRRQAETEQREYEAHIERTRLRGIHEVNRLGGGGLSEDEVRRRQAEQYRRDKFTRSEKTYQDQMQKKEEEEKAIQAKKQAARLQSIENEKRDRTNQLRSTRSTVNQSDEGATGWTDEAREEDRRQTMDRFLNRMGQQRDDAHLSSDEDEQSNAHNPSKSEKISILRNALPHVDTQTLERYYEIYNGNVDIIVDELLN